MNIIEGFRNWLFDAIVEKQYVKYQILKCVNPHGYKKGRIIYRVQGFRKEKWENCKCYPEGTKLNVEYFSKKECEEWIEEQLNKLTPEKWGKV